MQFPIGIFGASLATATLPAISQLWVKKDFQGVHSTLSSALRHIFAINLPASAGLAFLGYPIIELIFQYGRFQASDTRFTALALAMYAIGLTAYSAVKVLVPACYAMGNTRVPVLVSVFTVAVTLVLNLVFVRWIGFSGLALGTSLGALINFALLMEAVRRMLLCEGVRFELFGVIRSFVENLALSLVMGGVVYLSWQGLETIMPGHSAGMRLFRMLLLISEGGTLVLLLAKIFNLRETREAFEFFTQKLRSRLFEPAK
jgi:putative peptidoglycan lipid II flippase